MSFDGLTGWLTDLISRCWCFLEQAARLFLFDYSTAYYRVREVWPLNNRIVCTILSVITSLTIN